LSSKNGGIQEPKLLAIKNHKLEITIVDTHVWHDLASEMGIISSLNSNV
jgi:hypothetical protein